MSSSKLTASEPNLLNISNETRISDNNRFSKAFQLIKKTFSRKNLFGSQEELKTLNEPNKKILSENYEDINEDTEESINSSSKAYNSIIKRVRNNRKVYEKISSGNSQIYIEDVELNSMKTLFSYSLIVGLQLNKADEVHKKDYEPYLMWKFPENVVIF
jgi:hypothetical protein